MGISPTQQKAGVGIHKQPIRVKCNFRSPTAMGLFKPVIKAPNSIK